MTNFSLGKEVANNVKLAIPDKVVAGSVYAELRVIGKISASFLFIFLAYVVLLLAVSDFVEHCEV